MQHRLKTCKIFSTSWKKTANNLRRNTRLEWDCPAEPFSTWNLLFCCADHKSHKINGINKFILAHATFGLLVIGCEYLRLRWSSGQLRWSTGLQSERVQEYLKCFNYFSHFFLALNYFLNWVRSNFCFSLSLQKNDDLGNFFYYLHGDFTGIFLIVSP